MKLSFSAPKTGRSRAAALSVALSVVGALMGCASAPMYRPVSPPLDDKVFEAGAGVHGVVGQDIAGVGAAAWLQGQVAKDITLVARGHFTDLFPFKNGGGLFKDVQFGGAGGLRGTYRISDDLTLGGEALFDYQQLSSTAGGTQYFISGVAGFPVAEVALPNVWVYVEPQLGAGYRFGDNVEVPFAGFMECPIGVAWKPTDWAVIVAEGGFAIPFNGGYFGLSGAFRL